MKWAAGATQCSPQSHQQHSKPITVQSHARPRNRSSVPISFWRVSSAWLLLLLLRLLLSACAPAQDQQAPPEPLPTGVHRLRRSKRGEKGEGGGEIQQQQQQQTQCQHNASFLPPPFPLFWCPSPAARLTKSSRFIVAFLATTRTPKPNRSPLAAVSFAVILLLLLLLLLLNLHLNAARQSCSLLLPVTRLHKTIQPKWAHTISAHSTVGKESNRPPAAAHPHHTTMGRLWEWATILPPSLPARATANSQADEEPNGTATSCQLPANGRRKS